jgi:hypothetical protein
MSVELQAPPESSQADRNGPAVGLGVTLNGYRSLPPGEARALEQQALAFLAGTPAREALIIRRHPSQFELRFLLTCAPSDAIGSALSSELYARMVRLAEAAGCVGGAFGFEIFPLGFGFLPLPSKSATLVQTGVEHTPLQWRRAFDPEPY